MKGVTMLNNGRFISDHGPGTTCYYDSRHKLIKTRLSGGGFAELIKELQMDGSLLDAIQQPIKRDQSARHQQAEMQDLRGRYESLPPARERQVMEKVVSGLLAKRRFFYLSNQTSLDRQGTGKSLCSPLW